MEMSKSLAFSKTNESVTKEGRFRGINYFKHFYNGGRKLWYIYKNLPRATVMTINGIRSGHYNFNSSLAKISIINDPCSTCGYKSQDIDHVLWQCILLDIRRGKFIDQLIVRLHGFSPPLSCNTLLFKPP